MTVKKQCVTCKTVYEADTYEGLKQYFYVKQDWLRNECIECEKEDHRKKYADGKYNYRKRDDAYKKNYRFGCF